MIDDVRKGVVVIPDLSGFTHFVFNTKMLVGQFIVRELLNTLIDSNKNNFQVSEIEGDAILFYKYTTSPSYHEVSSYAISTLKDFNQKIESMNMQFDTKINLNLKFIVHYGDYTQYQVHGFNKLYGKPIVEAHQYLKNSYAQHSSYILFSNLFLLNANDFDFKLTSDKSSYIPKIGMIKYLF